MAIFVLSGAISCIAQVDTEFWFAPPEITSGHGDRPIYLRISTLNESAVVSVTQPARDTLLATVTVNANSTQTINLTSYISLIETNIPASVMRTGLKIVSTAPITAYYEVGAQWNSDIFVLKGRNGIGNKFVIPAQDLYDNSGSYSPTPLSSFDIVATENNTVVRVKPTRPVEGHQGQEEIVVKLNAGETYSFRKTIVLASDNPAGTVVESNKPIAISLKDDSVINQGCRDMLGDQLVPVAVAGSEYIIMQGFLNSSEFVFITATEDNTEIFVAGSATPAATLNAGGLFRHQITARSTYISSNKTIYAFHVTGFGCEMGMAILPSITCKGSQQIGFTRTTSEFFGMNIMVRKEGINGFTLNGSSSLITAASFAPVAGTNDQWYAAQLDFTGSQIPVGQGSLISNSKNSFQAGIINGDAMTTCRYGYFSAFSTLFIGDDFTMCEGSTAIIDAGPGKQSYVWNNGATSQQIEVSHAGTYWVKMEREDCILVDTVKVQVRKGELDLGEDIVLCQGDTSHVDGKENFSWEWSDGSRGQYLETSLPGKYWLKVHDYTGCIATDTIMISTADRPIVALGDSITKCPHEQLALDVTNDGATYLWDDGTTLPSRIAVAAGTYWAEVNLNGCRVRDSVQVINFPGPQQDTIIGSPSVCPFVQNVKYEVASKASSSFQWFIEGGTIANQQQHTITVNWGAANLRASVKALVTDSIGCHGDTLKFPVRINAELIVEIPDGPDTLCLNKSTGVVYTTPATNGSVYEWHTVGGTLNSGQGSQEISIDWKEGLNRLWITETSVTIDTVCSGTSPELQVVVFRDTAFVEMKSASVDTVGESTINMSWLIMNPERILGNEIYLFKRAGSETSWQLLSTLNSSAKSFIDAGNATDDHTNEYYMSAHNRCDEALQTNVHRTMRLTGTADTLNDIVSLEWTHYQGWEGVQHYEVWRKVDRMKGYRLLATVPGSENVFSSALASDGFSHRYVIRAVQRTGMSESWSNNITFTPNADEWNQFFFIENIHLYPQSSLTVFDRWGKTIFKAIGYQNGWDGEGVTSGVYYYSLDLNDGNEENQTLKGPLSILR